MNEFTEVRVFRCSGPWLRISQIAAWVAENCPDASASLEFDNFGDGKVPLHPSRRTTFRCGMTDDREIAAFKLRWEGDQ